MEKILLLPWFPAITTSGLLAIAFWLGQKIISERLSKSIEFEFSQKLEAVRTELRAAEERLKAQLREKEAEITALRGGALSALASRQAALDKRRLEAIDQLWSEYTALAPARAISSYMAVIKFESALKEVQRNPRERQVFEVIGAGFDLKALDLSGAAKARPFLAPMVWAVFVATKAVTMNAVLRWQVLKGGMSIGDIADHEAIKKLILTVLPYYKDYLETQGPDAYHYCIEALETKLLDEISSMMSGVELDKASIEQAAEIIRQVNDLQHRKSAV